MPSSDLTSLRPVLLLAGLAQALGHAFVRLRRPKAIGVILAGIVRGPAMPGHVPAVSALRNARVALVEIDL